MKKLVAVLFLSLAIDLLASDTYIYPPGLDSAIQHWQYPSTTAMTTDFGFYSQDIGKIAFNKGNGIYYYLADTTPTWTPMATGGGGGSTTFIGLVDVPTTYAGAAGQLVAVNGTATGLIFQAAAGGGNVSNVGTPAADENAVWTDPTHVKGTRTLAGGPTSGYVLTKLSGTDYDYGWAAAAGGSTVSITATSPILVTPSPITGTGVISLDPASDLAALEALSGANTIYYRSGTNAWSPVTIGSNLTFSGGILAATVGGTGTNAFGTIAVSGQSNVVASSAPDTLTLVAGSNVTLTTSAIGKSVTIASSGGAGGVTSISGTSPIQVSPNPITSTGTVSLESGSDLAAIEALTGTSTIYYRSGISAWSPVTMGSNMTFSAGALAAGNANWDTAYNERHQWDGGSTNLNATIGRGSLGATTIGSNVFTMVNPASVSWIKLSTAGLVTAEDATTTKTSLGLNTANWDTAYTDRMKWDTSTGISGGTTGQGRTALGATTIGSNVFTLANPLATSWMKVGSGGAVTLEDAPTSRTSLGLVIGTNVQAWGADLDALEALGGTNTIYYRSAASTWSPVTIGSNLTFTSGTLAAAGSVAGPASSTDLQLAIYSGTTGKVIRTFGGTGLVSVASGVVSTITDNSTNWNSAFSQTGQWTGTATGLVAATGRASLALNAVTNDVQTQAAIVPNTVPTDGQVLVGSTALGRYAPRTLANATLSATGALTGVTNAALASPSIQIGNTATATSLGGTATADQIIGATGLGYVKRTGSSSYTATTTSIPNGDLANSAITIATNSTSLGGTVTQDAITGLSGVGLVKHTGANALGLATAGTDYKAATTSTVIVKLVTTTSTYTVPASVNSLFIECVGGGGGGGGCSCSSGSSSAAAGGGGGGYAGTFVANPVATYSITIGAGGTAGVTGTAGGAGGTTTVGTILTATGGGGGNSLASCDSSGQVVWSGGGIGGTGTVGLMKSGGSDGGPAFSISNAGALGGNGGSSVFGGGAQGYAAQGSSSQGGAGNLYGGGGGGSATGGGSSVAGGVGAAGVVRIWEFY